MSFIKQIKSIFIKNKPTESKSVEQEKDMTVQDLEQVFIELIKNDPNVQIKYKVSREYGYVEECFDVFSNDLRFRLVFSRAVVFLEYDDHNYYLRHTSELYRLLKEMVDERERPKKIAQQQAEQQRLNAVVNDLRKRLK